MTRLAKFLAAVLAALLLAGCAAAAGDPLPLEDYADPLGRYTFAIPKGWQAESDTDTLTITPPGYTGGVEELRVVMLSVPTFTTDLTEHMDQVIAQLEPFLAAYLDEAYEVVNEGNTRVDGYPALLLDFAKPYQSTYLLGRVVLVAMPAYNQAFLGMGIEAEWEAFLPTFRAMLSEFDLLSAYAETPEN